METFGIIKQTELLGKPLAVYGSADNPLFLAKDVAGWIDVSNHRDLLTRVDDDEKVVGLTDTLGGSQQTTFLTEDGLYEVLMQSRKPIAKQFKKGVKEILKDIRQKGFYATTGTVDKILNDPDAFIGLLQGYKKEREERLMAQQQLAIAKPKAEYYDDLVERGHLTNFRDTAKELGVKQNAFVDMLIAKGYVYRDKGGKLKPYAKYTPKYFEVKDFKSESGSHTGTQTLITPDGKAEFGKIIKKK